MVCQDLCPRVCKSIREPESPRVRTNVSVMDAKLKKGFIEIIYKCYYAGRENVKEPCRGMCEKRDLIA